MSFLNLEMLLKKNSEDQRADLIGDRNRNLNRCSTLKNTNNDYGFGEEQKIQWTTFIGSVPGVSPGFTSEEPPGQCSCPAPVSIRPPLRIWSLSLTSSNQIRSQLL